MGGISFEWKQKPTKLDGGSSHSFYLCMPKTVLKSGKIIGHITKNYARAEVD